MPLSFSELDRFHQFARAKLNNGGADSLYELVDLWAAQTPDEAELRSSLAALHEGLADLDAGRVYPPREVFEELAERFGVKLPQ